MRAMTPAEAQLASWLQRLVAVLLGVGGAVARRLVVTVAGRGALFVLDEAQLHLVAMGSNAADLSVRVTAADGELPARLATTGDTLRAVIDGRHLLDAAVADGSIDLRADMDALLAFHELVLFAIALGPRRPELRALWAEFDAAWPRGPAVCAAIDDQPAAHGTLCRFVPPVVQLARSPLGEQH
ncbi:MAG TPA: hypothetical protein VMK32_09990 [Burkholderiaceae bacterium]|nr:hypothetical protein [Burkholderiaceae bacterium]